MNNDNAYLYCPITLELMTDPVIDKEGNSFERTSITEWLKREGRSPLTRTPIDAISLVPNRSLKLLTDRNRGIVPQRAEGIVASTIIALRNGLKFDYSLSRLGEFDWRYVEVMTEYKGSLYVICCDPCFHAGKWLRISGGLYRIDMSNGSFERIGLDTWCRAKQIIAINDKLHIIMSSGDQYVVDLADGSYTNSLELQAFGANNMILYNAHIYWCSDKLNRFDPITGTNTRLEGNDTSNKSFWDKALNYFGPFSWFTFGSRPTHMVQLEEYIFVVASGNLYKMSTMDGSYSKVGSDSWGDVTHMIAYNKAIYIICGAINWQRAQVGGLYRVNGVLSDNILPCNCTRSRLGCEDWRDATHAVECDGMLYVIKGSMGGGKGRGGLYRVDLVDGASSMSGQVHDFRNVTKIIKYQDSLFVVDGANMDGLKTYCCGQGGLYKINLTTTTDTDMSTSPATRSSLSSSSLNLLLPQMTSDQYDILKPIWNFIDGTKYLVKHLCMIFILLLVSLACIENYGEFVANISNKISDEWDWNFVNLTLVFVCVFDTIYFCSCCYLGGGFKPITYAFQDIINETSRTTRNKKIILLVCLEVVLSGYLVPLLVNYIYPLLKSEWNVDIYTLHFSAASLTCLISHITISTTAIFNKNKEKDICTAHMFSCFFATLLSCSGFKFLGVFLFLMLLF